MLYIGMLVFQLAGALILLLNNINISKNSVIRNCFPGTNVLERDDDDNCIISKGLLRKSAHKTYLNVIAFLDLVIGYGIAAFSPELVYSKQETVFVVICGAILLALIEFGIGKLVAYSVFRKDEIVSYEKLKKDGVDTFATEKEVKEMLDEVFRN